MKTRFTGHGVTKSLTSGRLTAISQQSIPVIATLSSPNLPPSGMELRAEMRKGVLQPYCNLL